MDCIFTACYQCWYYNFFLLGIICLNQLTFYFFFKDRRKILVKYGKISNIICTFVQIMLD